MLNLNVKIGNLTDDPAEIREVGQNNTPMTKFDIGVNDYEQKDSQFFRITVFGKQAENVVKYLTKGRAVAVIGRDQKSTFENKEGQTVRMHEIIANKIVFLNGGNNGKKSVEVDTSNGLDSFDEAAGEDPF